MLRVGFEVIPIHVASRKQDVLDYGGDVDGQGTIGQLTMLVLASIRGKLKGGGCLLDRRVDVEVRDDRSLTPLSI